MADVDIEARSAALLPGVHRVVRALDTAEGPFAGTLVTRGEGVAVRVGAAELAGWAGWGFSGAEHVAGPVDVVRREQGHDALLPWCTDRVLGFLVRRSAAGSALSSGECSTLVVSLVRGLDELGSRAEGVQTGVWWLTDGGRPIFVIGEGDDARVGVAKIIERLGEDCRDKALGRVLSAVQQGLGKALSQPRVPPRLLGDWEQEMLAVAAPRPLEREVYAPERARDVARAAGAVDRRLSPTRLARRADHRARAGAPRVGGRAAAFRAGMGAAAESMRLKLRGARDVLEARSKKTMISKPDAGSEADAGKKTPRLRLLVVAALAAAAVLAVGLFWPGGEGEEADAARGTPGSAQPSDVAAETPAASPTTAAVGDEQTQKDAGDSQPSPVESDGPEAAASVLLAAIADCRSAKDPVCADAVVAGSAGVIESLEAAADRAPAIELVDDYGDVAVLRLSSPGGSADAEDGQPVSAPDQMLVLARQDEKWLVRDVYSVADQPE